MFAFPADGKTAPGTSGARSPPPLPWRPMNASPGKTVDPYRRQQRRRAVIAWVTAAFFIALFVAAVIAGGNEESRSHEHPNPFGYSMTAKQYAGLRPGLEQQLFVNRLEPDQGPLRPPLPAARRRRRLQLLGNRRSPRCPGTDLLLELRR
jgi:hypothetical protein